MALALSVAGVLVAVAAWRLVAAGRVSVWTAMGTVMGLAGAAALLTGRPALAPRVPAGVATAAGLSSGLALFLATRAFVRVAGGWSTFRRHAQAIYGRRGALSLPAALGVAVGLVVTGEELFWRGLVQDRLAGFTALGRGGGALVAWALYVAVNVASGSVVLVAGALVAGAVWGGLALWTGGVLASLLCHAVWTGLMIVLPPVRPPARAERA